MKQITYCGALFFLTLLSPEDIRKRQVSARKVILFGLSAIGCRMLSGDGETVCEMIGCLIPGLLLLAAAIVSRENIGMGDGMAVMALGLWLGGWQTFFVLCIALMLAGLFAAVCLVKKKKEPIPFIPFLLLGMEVLLFYA